MEFCQIFKMSAPLLAPFPEPVSLLLSVKPGLLLLEQVENLYFLTIVIYYLMETMR